MASEMNRRGLFGLGFAAALARALPVPPLPARYDLLADSFAIGPGAIRVGGLITFNSSTTRYVVQALSRADIEFAATYRPRMAHAN